jgi:hypothetical protein
MARNSGLARAACAATNRKIVICDAFLCVHPNARGEAKGHREGAPMSLSPELLIAEADRLAARAERELKRHGAGQNERHLSRARVELATLRSGGASRRHAPMSPPSFVVRTENTCTPSPSRQTLSASVEESRAELASCPHLQPVISGMSSPCRQMYSLCSMSLSRIACFA